MGAYDNAPLDQLEAILSQGDPAGVTTAVGNWQNIAAIIKDAVGMDGSGTGLWDAVRTLINDDRWKGAGAEEFMRQVGLVATYGSALAGRAQLTATSGAAAGSQLTDFYYTTDWLDRSLRSAKEQASGLPPASTTEHLPLLGTSGPMHTPVFHAPWSTTTVDQTPVRQAAAAQLVNLLAETYTAASAKFPDAPDAPLPALGDTSTGADPFGGGGLGGAGVGGLGAGLSPAALAGMGTGSGTPELEALAAQHPLSLADPAAGGLTPAELAQAGLGSGAGLADPSALGGLAAPGAGAGSVGDYSLPSYNPPTDMAGYDPSTSLAGYNPPTGLTSPGSFSPGSLTPGAFAPGTGGGVGSLPGFGGLPGGGAGVPGLGGLAVPGGVGGSSGKLSNSAFKLPGSSGGGAGALGEVGGLPGGASGAGLGTAGRLGAAGAAAEPGSMVAGRAGSSGFMTEPVAGVAARGIGATAGAGSAPMPPMMPPMGGAGGQSQNGRQRGTWLYEDDDVFAPDVDSLPPQIIG
jgi:hypothetical protein